MSQCSQPPSCLCSASCQQPKRKDGESSNYSAGSWLQPVGELLVPPYPVSFRFHAPHSISIHPIQFHPISIHLIQSPSHLHPIPLSPQQSQDSGTKKLCGP